MKQLKIYIDENLAPQFAAAFNVIQQHLNQEEKIPIQVLSIRDEFGQGAQDEEWIPVIGSEGAVVITQDRRIQHSRMQRELYIQHGAGIFFLHSPKNGMSFWQMFKHLVHWWDEIKKLSRKTNRPFAYRQPGKARSFEKWEGDD